MIEIETLQEFDRARASAHTMSGWQIQGVDLTEREDALLTLDPQGALFLGSAMTDRAADRLRDGGALIFPEIPSVPFQPYRGGLYTPHELYAGLDAGYPATPDARIYAWSVAARTRPGLSDLLAQSLHDHAIDDALAEHTRRRRIVGVMGGHAWSRTDAAYAETARLAHELAGQGLTVATGGGPGAMEAANLGARLAGRPVSEVDRAVAAIAEVPDFGGAVGPWATVALEVAAAYDSGLSLGVPTWFYGHEPPNPFASVVAKYFRNAIREDVLLGLSRAGIVFLPGAGGTVQEIFQAACENYYAEPDDVAPMVLLGRDYWTTVLPAWPLLEKLGADRPMGPRLHLVDTTAEAVGALLRP